MQDRIAVLTFDVDWAPDFVMEPVWEALGRHGLSATVFCTGAMAPPPVPGVEYGLHPNFMPDSTQGGDEDEVLANLKREHPQAVSLRTHRNYWYAGLAPRMVRHGITMDTSLLAPFQPQLEPVEWGGLTRVPTWWTDSLHMARGYAFDRVDLPHFDAPGVKVFNFHPLHVYLNSDDPGRYRDCLVSAGSAQELTPEAAAPFVNSGQGVRTFFETLCAVLADGAMDHCRLKELAA